MLFVGKRLNERVAFLRELSIPEPVTGGLLFSILFGIVYAASGVTVEFDLAARNFLLVYFFTTIGINASFKDLLRGGKPLVVLLVITVLYMVIQNLTGDRPSHRQILFQPAGRNRQLSATNRHQTFEPLTRLKAAPPQARSAFRKNPWDGGR